MLPLLVASFSLVSLVGSIFSSLRFLGLVVGLCICIVHFYILHCTTCTCILIYIAMTSWCLLVRVYKRDHVQLALICILHPLSIKRPLIREDINVLQTSVPGG